MSSEAGAAPVGFGAWLRRAARSRWVRLYVALLALSHLVIALRQPDVWGVGRPNDGTPAAGERVKVRVPAQTATGGGVGGSAGGGAGGGAGAGVGGELETLSLLKFTPEREGVARREGALPVLLLHGSPSGGAADFKVLGPALADSGRDVFALDLPGFGKSGQWAPDYSFAANARYAMAALEALGVPRAHVVGWSQGGGSALTAADLFKDRVASVSLLGSIGVQEAEGSGSFAFEHVKYRVGYFALVVVPEVVPHFGLVGPRHFRHAFIRNFMDSDQRELDPLMRRLEAPTLIVHGRRDFLVPDWCAERTHELVRSSRLVMLDSNHFFPMGGEKNLPAMHQAAASMRVLFVRHDRAGVAALVGSANFAPHRESIKPELGGMEISHGMAWWAVILAIVAGTLILEDMTLIAVGLLIADGRIDPFVGLAGCFVGIVFGDLVLWGVGRVLGRRLLKFRLARRFLTEAALVRWGEMLDNHMGKAIFLCRCIPGTRMPTYLAAGILGRKTGQFVFWELMAVCVWAPALLIASVLMGPVLLGIFREVFHGPVAIVIALVVLFFVIRALSAEATYEGRHKNKAGLQRLWRYEFWPTWGLYLPVTPRIAWLALRHGPMSFTCVNPGVENAGGWVGESKSLMLRGLLDRSLGEGAFDAARVAPFMVVPAGPDPQVRASVAIDAVRSNSELGGYPVVLKPDHGQRGHAIKLARNDGDVRAYFETMTRAAMVQKFADMAQECGILWARRADAPGRLDDAPGEIIAVTRKVFPVIEGDGVRSLDHLIWDHPRHQMQAKVFLTRLGKDAERVPAAGEKVALGFAGNHCQGAMFLDGADLITPELTAAIDRLLRRFRGENGGRFDFGRLDVRFESEAELKRGRGFTIIEINGSSSEATNLYDPRRNLLWAAGVLSKQWTRLFELGARRRREGVKATGLFALLRMGRVFFEGLPGPRVSD
ncbi:MAG: alpha/beta fold hydrolase [Phycisphaerales bacterium]